MCFCEQNLRGATKFFDVGKDCSTNQRPSSTTVICSPDAHSSLASCSCRLLAARPVRSATVLSLPVSNTQIHTHTRNTENTERLCFVGGI